MRYSTIQARLMKRFLPLNNIIIAIDELLQACSSEGNSKMGMDLKVIGEAPAWPALRDLLAGRGISVQLRMIDGQLAFPDEQPPADWKELRIGTVEGMITLRREADGIRLVIWGNADGSLCRIWNAVTWAVASLCAGRIETGSGSLALDQFARTADLPEAIRTKEP
jgi:hypothetical protein